MNFHFLKSFNIERKRLDFSKVYLIRNWYQYVIKYRIEVHNKKYFNLHRKGIVIVNWLKECCLLKVICLINIEIIIKF